MTNNIYTHQFKIDWKKLFIYYVYIYFDPLTNIPFYVGYGKNNRYKEHLAEAKSTKTLNGNTRKIYKIRKIIAAGLKPIINFYAKNLSKNQATTMEIALIAKFGRLDLGTGTLTNMTSGGDGFRGWSKNQRHRMSEYAKNRISVKDPITNKKYRVKPDDPRWLSGELVGVNKGIKGVSNKDGILDDYIIAKDPITNKKYRVKPDDPRWISGELVGINKGNKAHPNTIAASSKANKGLPKSEAAKEKNRISNRMLKWYHNFTLGKTARYKDGEQPVGYVRVSGPHKKIPI